MAIEAALFQIRLLVDPWLRESFAMAAACRNRPASMDMMIWLWKLATVSLRKIEHDPRLKVKKQRRRCMRGDARRFCVVDLRGAQKQRGSFGYDEIS